MQYMLAESLSGAKRQLDVENVEESRRRDKTIVDMRDEMRTLLDVSLGLEHPFLFRRL